MRSVAAFSIAFLVAAASPARADTVKLKNGDVLTGKVVSVLEGKVTLKTDAAGDVKIDVAQVDTIATDEPLEIELSDGTTLRGRAIAASGGTFTVDSAALGQQPVSFAAVSAINKPPREWNGAIAASATWVRGNTSTDAIALDATAENRGDFDRITAEAWYRVLRSEDPSTGDKSTTERRMGVAGKYDYFFLGGEAYAYANVRAEKDALAAIDLRAIVGAGVGYQFVETESTVFNAEAGLAWFYENYDDGTDTVSDPAGRVAGHFTHKFNDENSFFDDAELYKVFGAHDDYLFRTKGGFRHQLTTSFFAQEWIEWVWDSTPADGKERVDVTYFLGIGWSF